MATVNATSPRVEITATAGQTIFTYPYLIQDEEDIEVYQNDVLLTITTHYTVTGVGNENGGTVVLVTPATLDDSLVLIRNTVISRDAKYTTGGVFRATTVEAEETEEYLIMQELEEDINRAITPAKSSTVDWSAVEFPDPTADTFLGWDAAGTQLENKTIAAIGAIELPPSSTDNAIARWDGTSGADFQDSPVTIDDSGNIAGANNITLTGTVDGRDIDADGTKLDGIEALADVTDETNVVAALDGATLPTATVDTADKVVVQDADDSDNLKTVTAQAIADLAGAGLTQETPQATTSGTAIDFTGLPSGIKRITITLVGVSLSGTEDILFQIGDSGGLVTSGYAGGASKISTASVASIDIDAGFGINGSSATDNWHGSLILTLHDTSNTWVASGTFAEDAGAPTNLVAGSLSLSNELDRIRITRSGSDTFDAGEVNVVYE